MAPFSSGLAEQGLNLQAVFAMSSLPDAIHQTLEQAITEAGANPGLFRQLLLLGHGGRRLWECVAAAGHDTANPIDDYSVGCIRDFFASECPTADYRILYPGESLVPLQQLGQLAGWHFPSPFMVGVNSAWGSWYAYRALVVASTDFATSMVPGWQSPCEPCTGKPCMAACPAGAATPQGLDMERCISFRKQQGSPCQRQCLARLACPVGEAHRYTREQLEYHYQLSYRTLCERY